MQVPQTAHPRYVRATAPRARMVRIDDHVRFGP